MLAIKLSRYGKKKQPIYRLIVLEKTKDPWGDYLENLGIYNPKSNPKIIDFKADRIKYWIEKGAKPTDTVWNLLISKGIITGKKLAVTNVSKRRAEKLKAKKASAKPEAKEAPASEEKAA